MSESDDLESPKPQSSLKCPRCESTNTKFCYFNNYNKTQPRHFCKACKRHWTEGGTLRTVPVGGGRKNKRLRRPYSTATTATKNNKDQDSLVPPLSKSDFCKPIGSHERGYDVESYTDIEELKGLVSWDFYGSFIGCTVQLGQEEDDQRLAVSKTFETNPSGKILQNDEDSTTTTTSMIMATSQQWQLPSTSNFLELNNWNWNDLDTTILDDMHKPWEDPTFKT